MVTTLTVSAGQKWLYRAPPGFEPSRMVVGAIVRFSDSAPIICCEVTEAPRRLPDATVDVVTIPFLPMTEDAFLASVVELDGMAEVGESFQTALADWQEDPRGMSAFTVPFEGHLNHLIARQMEAILQEAAG